MAGTNNNFKHLQDYEISPPTGLFVKLWKKIKRNVPEKQHVQTEFQETANVPENSASSDLSNLKSYTSPDLKPPPYNFQKIKEAAAVNKSDSGNLPVHSKKAIHFNYKLLAAAAITGVIFLTYHLIGNGNLYWKSNNTRSVTTDSRFDSTLHSNTKNGLSSTTGNKNLKTKNPLLKSNLIYASYFISKNGNSTLHDNDFTYTLTSFTYDESISFLKKLKKDKLISLNSYSYLNVSEKIAVFLKEMYEVTDKGKPTRKAKKLKHKLAKWKKKDESYFDRNPQKNPLDIIDLSELILK